MTAMTATPNPPVPTSTAHAERFDHAVRAARSPRHAPAAEVNERYRRHPVTGSFTVDTEGEITRWETFAAHGSRFSRPTAA